MKPTQITELFANIRKTFVSFFSILMFVALGVGIYLGISWAAPALQQAAEGVFDEGAFHHFQVQFPYGLTDDDLAKLAALDGVSGVEGVRQSFQTAAVGGKTLTVKVQSAGERIDVPIVREGSLPERAGEIALLASAAADNGIAVGDTIAFEPDATGESAALYDMMSEPADAAEGGAPASWQADDASADEDGMQYLTTRAFKVVGLVDSGEYLAKSPATYGFATIGSGAVDVVAWVSADAFDASAFFGGWPVVNVSAEALGGMGTFADDYKGLSGAIEARLAELGCGLSVTRYDELHGRAQSKVDEGQRQIDEGKRQIADGEAQLAAARTELEAKRAEGEAQLASAWDQLQAYEAQKAEAEQLDAQAKEPITTGEALVAGKADDDTVTYEGQTVTVAQAKELIALAKQELAKAEAELAQKRAQLADGWNRYYAGQAQLEAAVAEGEAKIAEGERQVEEAKRQVAEAEPKVAQARERVGAMKRYDWTVLSRAYNASVAEVGTFSGVTTNLSFSMAALFVIVGLLVSYSAVSRIVHEQITQIGTKKALGLRAREITVSFLAYSALAVIAGAVVGTIVGVTLVEGVIGRVLGGMFVMGDYPPYFGLGLFAGVTVLELALVLGATWLACRSILREQAVELLKGEKPPEAKARFYERWGVWDRLPLLTQTIVNNCVNDRRRVFSTVVGVAGCTALIVTALTLNDNVLASYDKHYDDVYGFNAITYVDASAEGGAVAVKEALREQGADATAAVQLRSMAMELPNGEHGTAHVIVPADAGSFAGVYHVNPVSGGTFSLDDDGVWVSQAYAEHTGAKAGDMLVLQDADGVRCELPILGFYEFWLTYHEVVMGAGTYERAFGTAPAENVVLADTGDVPVADAGGALAATPGFDSIVDDKDKQAGDFREFASVSRAVVLIYMALSVLMAIVVLLNLNVMFIDEKRRELIVLMINGFSVKDAKRYIYNDTIVLTAIGIACGIVLGCTMGSVTVGAVEPSTAAFVKSVDWRAVAAGVVGSAVLALVMSVMALRRIPRFDLTDINKF